MARNDRRIRGIRTPLKANTIVGRLSPGEGDAEMVDAAELASFIQGELALGIDVEDEGSPIANAGTLNFVGGGVTATDAGGGQVDVTIQEASLPPWQLIDETTISGSTSQIDYTTELSGLSDVMIVFDSVTASNSSFRSIRLSDDGGSTFYSSSGDYRSFATSGSTSNATEIQTQGTGSTAALSGVAILLGLNQTGIKPVIQTRSNFYHFPASTSPIDGIRLFTTVGTMEAGTVRLFGR